MWVLQRALGALHYAVPQSGYFDEATADAVIAYRKVTGLARVGYADAGICGASPQRRRLPRALPAGRQAHRGQPLA